MQDEPKLFNQPRLSKISEFIYETRGFYIPAYQRSFSWTKENWDRFFEDVSVGIKGLMKGHGDTVTFIGSMICFADNEFRTVHPQFRNELPASVYAVIDGQQRLTVLMLISAALHDYIRLLCDDDAIGDRLRDQAVDIRDKAVDRRAELNKLFELKRESGEFPYYPRMIRSFDDVWSRKGDERQYRSPLSYYISRYSAFVSGGNRNAYKHQILPDEIELSGEQRKAHETIRKAADEIKKTVSHICEGKFENFPDLDDLFSSRELLKELLNVDPSDIDVNQPKRRNLAVATILASYVLHKIYFVAMVTTDESCAFDLFESLNTTGLALTAYETFKPEIVKFETIEQFERSESKKHTDVVDRFLVSLTKTNEKAKTTAEMLVSFALAENGKTLGKSLREQREYLRNRYNNELSAGTEKREFTRHLMHSAELMKYYWDGGGRDLQTVKGFSDAFEQDATLGKDLETVCFCLSFLRGAGHQIVRALFTRFHESAKISDASERVRRIRTIFHVIKAAAAFFALWRGSRDSTDGIDNRHRRLVRDGIGNISGSLIRGATLPTETEIRRAFCHLLREDGGNSQRKIDFGNWLARSGETPVYRGAKQVARFLLLVAANNTRGSNGLLEKVRPGARASLIASNSWGDESHETVEHIIPQSSAVDLPMDLDDLHRLGNLTLVPRFANSILGARPWAERRQIFFALSAESDDELRVASEKIDFLEPDVRGKILTGRYLPMTQAVAQWEFFGTQDGEEGYIGEAVKRDIEKRGKNLAELAWKTLALDWLKFDESDEA